MVAELVMAYQPERLAKAFTLLTGDDLARLRADVADGIGRFLDQTLTARRRCSVRGRVRCERPLS